MAFRGTSSSVVVILSSFFLVLFLMSVCEGGVLFSSLERTLVVSASLNNQSAPFEVARAGSDQLHVSWSLNKTFAPGVDASYKTVKIKLCFAPYSQVDRSWRKTTNDLHKDKTCSIDIASQPFNIAGNSTNWTIPKKTPGAIYFVRAYAMDAADKQVGFGQTTNKNKTTNLFVVEPITGRSTSLDIAAACFSALSVISLFGFFIFEKKFTKQHVK